MRDTVIPDHGLISSYGVYQPPGLVWVTMPFVAVGGGRPELVIVGFAMLNAAAVALLVATVARAWGVLYAAVLGLFLIVGPDVWFSAVVWHSSLYWAAMCLVLTAGIRLPIGSRWWSAVLVALPGLYALILYSGVILFAPALALLVLSRRTWKQLVTPAAAAIGVVVCAWAPFLAFEVGRDWVDLRTIVGEGDNAGSLWQAIDGRFSDLLAVAHLGHERHDHVGLTWVLWPLVVLAVVIAVARRQWRDKAFLLPAVVVATGVLAQVVANQGERQDVLMLWLVPLYALAAWATVQVARLPRDILGRRAMTAAVLVLVAVVGSVDLVRAVRATQRTCDSVSSGTRRGRVRRSRTSLASSPWSRRKPYFPCGRRMTGDQRCGTSVRSFAREGPQRRGRERRVPLEGGQGSAPNESEASPRVVDALAEAALA